MNILKKVIIIILSITIVIGLLISIDVILISKYQKGPIFAIKTKTYHDGGTKEYCGIGYKVIKYHQKQGRRDIVLGTYNLKYDIDPLNLDILDLSIEINKNDQKTYRKYNRKFVRINAQLKEINTKNNSMIIGFIDEDEKYSLDINCNMATNKKELSKLVLYDDIVVIGTVYDYESNPKTKIKTIYLNNCFSEQ